MINSFTFIRKSYRIWAPKTLDSQLCIEAHIHLSCIFLLLFWLIFCLFLPAVPFYKIVFVVHGSKKNARIRSSSAFHMKYVQF